MKFRMKKGMLLTLILLSMGIIGGVLFFPINFDNQYTCLYNRVFAPKHHYELSNEMINSGTRVEEYYESEIDEMMHSELVRKYILPFGLVWWFSLVIIAFAFFWLKHLRHEEENLKKL